MIVGCNRQKKMKTYVLMIMLYLSSSVQATNYIKENGVEVIMNPNFGSALIPEDTLVNSGSIWRHTFHIEDPFIDPIPLFLRENITLTISDCDEILTTVTGLTNQSLLRPPRRSMIVPFLGDWPGLQANRPIAPIASSFCEKLKKMSGQFNDQKELLIKEIDKNMESVRHLAYIETDLRNDQKTRKKRAPLEIIGSIGEKLFGLAQNKNVKTMRRNLELLKEFTVTEYKKVRLDMMEMSSVNLMQNEAILNVSRELKDLQEELVDIVQYMEGSLDEIDKTLMHTITESRLMYHIADMRGYVTTSSIALLGALTLTRIKTGELREGMQKVSAGTLPSEIVPVADLVRALEEIDLALMTARSNFRLAITDPKYYYGMPISIYGYRGQIGIMIEIPLTTVGAKFQNYRIQTFKLPVPVKGVRENSTNSQITNFVPYFAMSSSGEHYLELTEQDLSRCRGLDDLPKICSPVKFMYSTKARPSCGLALYKGDTIMMKEHCHKEYYEEEMNENAQIYQVGSTSTLLITSPMEKLVKDCNDETQMTDIEPCKLCTLRLPCGCKLKSSTGIFPAIGTDCANDTSTEVKYPVNLMVLSRLLNNTQLQKYNGSVTFTHPPDFYLPPFELKKAQGGEVVSLDKASYILEKIIDGAIAGTEMYASTNAYLQEPQTYTEAFVKSRYADPVQASLFVAQGIGIILAVIGYRRGCSAAATGGILAASLTDKVKSFTLPPVGVPTPTEEISLYQGLMRELRDAMVVIAIIIVALIGWKMIRYIAVYLTTRQYLTPCDGLSTAMEITNVYLQISDGSRSMSLFVFTLKAPNTNIRLLQQEGVPLEFRRIPKFPQYILAYAVPFTSDRCVLSLGYPGSEELECLKINFPNKIRVPITKMCKFRKITKNPYTIRVFVGNEIYYELVPNIVPVPLPSESQGPETRISYPSPEEESFERI